MTRYNYQNLTNFSRYRHDLQAVGGYTIHQISCPYDLSNSWNTSVQYVYRQLRDELRRRNRIMSLVYGYYLGELISFSVTPRLKWLKFVEEQQIAKEKRYYLGATRIYKLFENDISQLYRTLYFSFRRVSDMRNDEFQQLVEYNRSLEDIGSLIEGTL